MRAVAHWLPRAVPRVLGEDAEAGWFAMDYLAPEDHPLWKAQLLAGIVEVDFAAAVGRDLAIIHAQSAADPNIPAAFANDDTFEAIRIEPYLRATGRAHPELASRFDELARDDSDDQARAGSRRHQSEEHPPRPRRTRVPRRRMRLVRRPRLRSCLLSQSSPAQGRARGRRPDALHRRLSPRWQAPISLASTGRARRQSKRARPLCCRLCSSPGSTASRRSSTSRRKASARQFADAPRR